MFDGLIESSGIFEDSFENKTQPKADFWINLCVKLGTTVNKSSD